MAQPWRATAEQTLALPQVNNNSSSMRLNNTKNNQMRSSSRTLKQPAVYGPLDLEVFIIYETFR